MIMNGPFSGLKAPLLKAALEVDLSGPVQHVLWLALVKRHSKGYGNNR
jgi:hypothetical protein